MIRSRSWRTASRLSVLLVAACDFPTDLPIIDSRWVIPIPSDSVTVEDILAGDVTIDGEYFAIAADRAEDEETLADLCPLCPNGIFPKPAFLVDLTTRTTLPDELVQATLADGGVVEFTLLHDLALDPLRPTPSARGDITMALYSGGTLIANSVIDGDTTALPPDVEFRFSVPIPAGSVVSNDIEIVVTIVSPAGGISRLDRSQRILVSVQPQNIRASSAVIRIDNQVMEPSLTEFDVGEVDESVRSRVQDATLELVLDNPFPIAGEFRARFLANGDPLIPERTVPVTGGNETIAMPLSQDEIDAILDAGLVQVEFSGTFTGSAPNQEVTVTPDQVLRIAPRLVIGARIGD
jgi:hypothetical protein